MTAPLLPLVLLAGPTASGKSSLALALAEALGGTVINADSLQVYRDLRIVTARPTPAEEARVPHRLYGVLDGDDVCSAARWAGMAADAAREAWTAGRVPILVGGTGLYMKALTEGLAAIPDIPPDIRAAARARLEELGNAAFHADLAARDPDMAARLDPGNSQRLARAWEVLEATGRSLAWWQDQPPAPPPLSARTLTIVLDPEREALRAAIDARFAAMVEAGALDEVRALLARALPADRPVMKAVGVPDLAAHLRGDIDLATATARAQAATRQYAKRQRTWLRHQMRADLTLTPTLAAQYSETLAAQTIAFVRRFLLTV
ncbi:tRNA (adenosine(37)-N6)-dimethylallyltransferase MiaA [uncultured Rhodospira sp.]|uniref:tRNA (adenosine(37)-N6)-dimethylallyltransferase MiaA n=1 Tax=uncultured Rhodospira sp. TaxID=1936189 RepID=UPI002610F921|nr:tRNA (adenosine(37)-N6)-dimethylallyltransferase MiaA [uncultured Rhodospira sp.]